MEEFNEYNDFDATSCALGDYNAWEEEQVFQDREGDDDWSDNSDYEDDHEREYDCYD